MVQSNSTPHHDAGTSPRVSFQDTVISKTLPSSSPHSHSAVSCRDAIPAFIREDHSPPVPVTPVPMQCSPLETSATVSNSEDRTPVRPVTSDISLSQTPAHCVVADWSLMTANGCPCSFGSSGEAVLQVVSDDLSILPQCCNWRSATSRTVGCASSGLNTLLQSVYCSDMNIEVISNMSCSLAGMESSQGLVSLLPR